MLYTNNTASAQHPAGNEITIRYPEENPATLTLINSFGQRVGSQTLFTGNNIVNTAHLANGLYIALLRDTVTNQQQSVKVVIQK